MAARQREGVGLGHVDEMEGEGEVPVVAFLGHLVADLVDAPLLVAVVVATVVGERLDRRFEALDEEVGLYDLTRGREEGLSRQDGEQEARDHVTGKPGARTRKSCQCTPVPRER